MEHATTAWGRHIASRDAWWHAISVVVYGGATITACRGRWPTGDAIESHDNPPENKRCGACVAVLAAAGEELAVLHAVVGSGR